MKNKLFKKILIFLVLIPVCAIIYLITKGEKYRLWTNDKDVFSTGRSNLKTFTNEKFAFRLQYPETMNVVSKDQNPKGSIHEYFYIDDKEEFRLHVTPETTYDKSEYYRRSETLGTNIFDVYLYPKGLDLGEFTLNEPILYYEVFKNNTRYAFQFNNQRFLTNTERNILKTLQIN